MAIQLHGRWSLEITEAVHSWENRFRIADATVGSGTYPPTIGSMVNAEGPSWALIGEYRESDESPWKPTKMMIDPGLDRVDIEATIGAEDPLPTEDYRDVRWTGRYLDDSLFDIPYRPYAVRRQDLFQMPDGIFETALGSYYLAVRVINRWGLPFTTNHVLDISSGSRADLAMRGIVVDDAWTYAELTALGQSMRGTGVVLGPLEPGAARTVYFKVDVTAAAPRKHEVEFVCHNMAGMADPGHPARRIARQIFVSSTSIDPMSGALVFRVVEGTLRMRLREIAIDRKTGKRGRRRCPAPPARHRPSGQTLEEIRGLLQTLLEGRKVDLCELQRLIANACCPGPCSCPGDHGHGGSVDPWSPSDGTNCYTPFLVLPTRFDFTVTPAAPFPGQHGPVPFEDPWWKVALLIIAAVLLLAGALSEAADLAYHGEDLVIGSLGRVQRDDVDAALCVLDTDRALAFLTTLDAQSDEDFLAAVTALGGDIPLTGPVMTRTEVEAILLLPMDDPQRQVHKSGARTGLTHAIMTGLSPTGHDLATWNIDQLVLETDPAFGEPVSRQGDSGSVWVHTATLRPVALHHSGNTYDDNGGSASLLEDVQTRLGITI
ncbi:hypothetical protein AB0K98_29850 [Streptomyces werraensis]|uniref:hypothetical protein n=1 Tax=Streptomyces werraensis TaxID=68284 RepID=UPI0034440BC6